MNTIFQACLAHILKVEGGFVDNPRDPGGATNFGITLQTLADYSGLPSLPISVVKNLTQQQAEKIYEHKYWNVMRLDRVRSKNLCLVLFDQGVNGGPVTAIKMLQEVLNESFGEKLTVDGVIGNKTDVAIATASEEKLLRKLIQKAQLRYITICVNNPSQLEFLRGWFKRTVVLQDATMI